MIASMVVELDATLRVCLNRLDFSIFKVIPPLSVIDQHTKTTWYAPRFSGGLSARRPRPAPTTRAYRLI